jgi:phospholipid-translocating ATPase
MLTGDKLETAMCIGVSTALKPQGYNFFQINSSTKEGLELQLAKFQPVNQILIIQGSELSKITLNQACLDLFLAHAMKSKSVIVCRCDPL